MQQPIKILTSSQIVMLKITLTVQTADKHYLTQANASETTFVMYLKAT